MRKIPIINLTDDTAPKPKGKPAEFVWFINDITGDKLKPDCQPKDYDHVQCIRRSEVFDIFIAFDTGDGDNPKLYLGHYNDGFIEEGE